jgi:hypothetical protein
MPTRPAKAVQYAIRQIGKPYQWAGAGPNTFDCSGLTMRAFQAAGYTMPHNAQAQLVQTLRHKIKTSTTPPPGALIFFGPGPIAVHVGLSVGGGTMIEAPHTGSFVKYYLVAEEASGLPIIAVTDPLGAAKDVTTPAGFTDWRSDLLTRLDAPHTAENREFLNAWARREGAGGRNNPLNTTKQEPNSTSVPNTPGVQNYPTPTEGASATYLTLVNGPYDDIVSALRSGTASTSKDYQGLHNWSAGPNGPASKGYFNLRNIPTTPPTAAANETDSGGPGATTAAARGTGGKASGCQHSVGLKVLGSVCLDKPIAAGAMLTGGLVMLAGVAVILVAGFKDTGAGAKVGKAAAVLPGTAGVVAKAAQAPKRRRVRQEQAQAATVTRRRPAEAAARRQRTEARQAEAHAATQARARTRHRRSGTAAAQRVRHRQEAHDQRISSASALSVRRQQAAGRRSMPGPGHEPYSTRPRRPAKPLPDKAPF